MNKTLKYLVLIIATTLVMGVIILACEDKTAESAESSSPLAFKEGMIFMDYAALNANWCRDDSNSSTNFGPIPFNLIVFQDNKIFGATLLEVVSLDECKTVDTILSTSLITVDKIKAATDYNDGNNGIKTTDDKGYTLSNNSISFTTDGSNGNFPIGDYVLSYDPNTKKLTVTKIPATTGGVFKLNNSFYFLK